MDDDILTDQEIIDLAVITHNCRGIYECVQTLLNDGNNIDVQVTMIKRIKNHLDVIQDSEFNPNIGDNEII